MKKLFKKAVAVVAVGYAVVGQQAYAAVSSVVPADYAADVGIIGGDIATIGGGIITLALTAVGIKWVKGTLLS